MNRIALLRDGTIENVIVADCTPDNPGRLRDLFASYDAVALADELDGLTVDVDTDEGKQRAQIGVGDKLPNTHGVRLLAVRSSSALEAERLELEETARLEAEALEAEANDGDDDDDDDDDEIIPPDFPDEDL